MQIKINGMHCNACKMLVGMELEEHGYGELVEGIELTGKNEGTITLKELRNKQLEAIKLLINKMENYEIIN